MAGSYTNEFQSRSFWVGWRGVVWGGLGGKLWKPFSDYRVFVWLFSVFYFFLVFCKVSFRVMSVSASVL